MSFHLRKMTKDDIDSVVDLEIECFQTPWGREIIEPCMEDEKYVYLVLCEDNRIIGYCCVYVFDDTCEIFRIAITRAYRRRGYGYQAIKEIIPVAKEKNATRILLEVRASNTPAINLYEKCGFVKYGKRANYYGGGEDAVLYTLEFGGE